MQCKYCLWKTILKGRAQLCEYCYYFCRTNKPKENEVCKYFVEVYAGILGKPEPSVYEELFKDIISKEIIILKNKLRRANKNGSTL
jgi:hypothetical protein